MLYHIFRNTYQNKMIDNCPDSYLHKCQNNYPYRIRGYR